MSSLSLATSPHLGKTIASIFPSKQELKSNKPSGNWMNTIDQIFYIIKTQTNTVCEVTCFDERACTFTIESPFHSATRHFNLQLVTRRNLTHSSRSFSQQ